MTALVLAGAAAPTAVQLCHRALAAGSKSFALASRLLPAGRRGEAAVLYAWCRRADDAVDDAPRAAQPAALLRLRDELALVYAGRAHQGGDIVLEAFAEVVARRRVPRTYPALLLEGMAMDVAGVAYRTLPQLYTYCYRVAGVVGLMMSHVVEVDDRRALRHAAHLGMAMQLTNICRDVDEDWRLGRLYLPDDLLGGPELRARLGAATPPAAAREAVRGAVRALLADAERFYRSGDAGLRALPWRARLAVRTARLVYAAIGARLARRGHDALAGRTVVGPAHKLALAGRAIAAALVELPGDLARGFHPADLTTQAVRFPDDILPL